MITFKHGFKIKLANESATQALASALAKVVVPGLIIYLHGNLGVGKTTLARALLTAMGHTGAIKSPTYTLVEIYNLPQLTLYHFDLYRLADPAELEFIGIRDYTNHNAMCLFEWPENGVGHIPAADIEISLEFDHLARTCTIQANTDAGVSVLQKLTIGIE